jgi:hypothetical protein
MLVPAMVILISLVTASCRVSPTTAGSPVDRNHFRRVIECPSCQPGLAGSAGRQAEQAAIVAGHFVAQCLRVSSCDTGHAAPDPGSAGITAGGELSEQS